MPGFIKHILSGFGWSNGRVQTDDPDELVVKATTHFAADFCNPNMGDCPSPSTILAIISAEMLPAENLREHMLMCSECFAYYRRELTAHRANKSFPVTGASSRTRRIRLIPTLAGGLAGLLAVFAFVVISNRFEGVDERGNLNRAPSSADPSLASGSNPESKPAPPEPTATQPPVKREPDRQSSSSSSVIAQNKVSIDLENYDPLRGAVLAHPPPVQLQATQNELLIKLPQGSPQGAYSINLSNPYGRALRSTEAISRDGVQLRFDLNLFSVKPGDYLICLTRPTEVPQCIPAVVKPAVNKR